MGLLYILEFFYYLIIFFFSVECSRCWMTIYEFVSFCATVGSEGPLPSDWRVWLLLSTKGGSTLCYENGLLNGWQPSEYLICPVFFQQPTQRFPQQKWDYSTRKSKTTRKKTATNNPIVRWSRSWPTCYSHMAEKED